MNLFQGDQVARIFRADLAQKAENVFQSLAIFPEPRWLKETWQQSQESRWLANQPGVETIMVTYSYISSWLHWKSSTNISRYSLFYYLNLYNYLVKL